MGTNMKKLLFLAISTFISTQTFANEPLTTDKIVEKCSGFAEVAESAVQARQKGIPAAHMYKSLINKDKNTQAILKLALEGAYKTPLGRSKEEKETIILEYTNETFNDCMKFLTEYSGK